MRIREDFFFEYCSSTAFSLILSQEILLLLLGLLLTRTREHTRRGHLIQTHAAQCTLIPCILPPLPCLLVDERALPERVRAAGCVYREATLWCQVALRRRLSRERVGAGGRRLQGLRWLWWLHASEGEGLNRRARKRRLSCG